MSTSAMNSGSSASSSGCGRSDSWSRAAPGHERTHSLQKVHAEGAYLQVYSPPLSDSVIARGAHNSLHTPHAMHRSASNVTRPRRPRDSSVEGTKQVARGTVLLVRSLTVLLQISLDGGSFFDHVTPHVVGGNPLLVSTSEFIAQRDGAHQLPLGHRPLDEGAIS